MEFVPHHGRETAYRLAGDDEETDGLDVLYVHGSGATHRVWAAQYGPDGPWHPTTALDLSGHGDSDDIATDPGQETLSAYARDVVAVARETDTDVLVGNSLGGAVVQHVVLETEFEPAGLVLAGTGAKLTVIEDLREWLADDFERAVKFLHGDDMLFHDVDDRTVERSKAEIRDTGQAVTRRDFLTCHEFDVRGQLDEIDVPTLAVVGEHDSLTPPAYHEHLVEHLPDCEYAEIEDAAHLSMAERPAAFSRTMREFLDGLQR